ncbi:MAG: hypothetical protein WC205_09190 [Opitutaceae bacterium]|jgi:hypothetical protein
MTTAIRNNNDEAKRPRLEDGKQILVWNDALPHGNDSSSIGR